MVKNRMVRGSIAVAAALVPLGGVTALAASPAGAVPHGITCSVLKGSYNTSTGAIKTKVSTCTGNTGGSGKSSGNASDTTITEKWTNGKATTSTVSATAGSGCTQAGAITEVESGTVTADNTGSTTIGAAVSATVCVYPNPNKPGFDKITLLKGTQLKIAA